MKKGLHCILFVLCVGMFACSSPSNKRAVSIDELDNVQAAEAKEMEAVTSTRATLTANELIALSDCSDLPCVQLFMKDRSRDFVHAKKGEFASQQLGAITDTAGTQLQMPVSTFYVDVNPQASWRAAHTIHSKEAGDQLLAAFHNLGFKWTDSGRYLGIGGIQQRFASQQFPGKSLYVSSTYQPWYLKGLYNRRVTWPCYVFEVYNDK